MADADSEAMLLDRIVGKYGEGSDFDDLGNADEDALLEDDDPDFGVIKRKTIYHDESEELDHEPEEPDTEDVLDLEAQDVELEDDLDEKNNLSITNSLTVSSTTQPELKISILNRSDLEERERDTDKFKNERQGPASKSYNIPDSLDEVPVSAPRNNRNGQRIGGLFRGRGRGNFGNNQRNNQQQNNRPDNKTVLINPHFKGQVKINNEARLAWDARQRITQKNQVGKVIPFSQNNRKNPAMAPIQPWINNLNVSVPQYQPPAPLFEPPAPLFEPPVQQPTQVSTWNQYQPNSYNQVPQQMSMNHQHVFMQPLPQNIYPNHPPPQFNQPPPQFNSPMFQNQNLNVHPQPPVFPNQQFMGPPPHNQQFHQPMEPNYHQGYNQSQPPQFAQPDNQFMPPPPNPQFNQMTNNRFVVGNQQNNNHYRNQRFVRQKTNFNQGRMPFNQKVSPKRKVDGNGELRKKKRSVASTNLHEVRTVETPDTTVREDKPPDEEEDEEMMKYRLGIAEQARERERVLALKEQRRKQAASRQVQSNTENVVQVIQQQHPKPRLVATQQRNLQVIHTSQTVTVRTVPSPLSSQPGTSSATAPHISNSNIINTNNDENNYDKEHLQAFLSNRKILAKDQNLVDTSIVVVSNLAAGTTDVKLRRMCQGIGDIKKLQMSPKERQATIQFNSVASAHAFFKKYQRTMLDLSMIQVSLKPMTQT